MTDRSEFWSRMACYAGASLMVLSMIFNAHMGPFSLGAMIGEAVLAGAGLLSSAILAVGR